MAFKDLTEPKDIKAYLLNVLSRTGGKTKENAFLYHYTNIEATKDILCSGYFWLGSSARMNDFFEGDLIDLAGIRNRLFFTCFSRAEENLAMYKVYAPSPNGVMLKLPFADAEQFTKLKTGYIVRDNQKTDEKIDITVYWAAVSYKDLHTNLIKAGDVVNTNIKEPLNVPELVGYVKMYGWEYEKEVRLCVMTSKPLEDNEKVAVKVPVNMKVSIVTGPGFDTAKNRKSVSVLKRKEIPVTKSEYDQFVDLGFSISTASEKEIAELKKRIEELENENATLQKKLKETNGES